MIREFERERELQGSMIGDDLGFFWEYYFCQMIFREASDGKASVP